MAVKAESATTEADSYLVRLRSIFDFCLPTLAKAVPSGPDWLHEIKMDGYRLRLERDGDRVRLITRGGYDWTERFPRIVEAARHRQFVADGEAGVLGVNGISDGSRNAQFRGQEGEIASPCGFAGVGSSCAEGARACRYAG